MIPYDAPLICTSCHVPHIENCPACYGFGVYGDALPVRPWDAVDGPLRGVVVKCPTCGSDERGVPTMALTTRWSLGPFTLPSEGTAQIVAESFVRGALLASGRWWDRLHEATHTVGASCLCQDCRFPTHLWFSQGSKLPDYADIRDHLITYQNVDERIACRVALRITWDWMIRVER